MVIFEHQIILFLISISFSMPSATLFPLKRLQDVVEEIIPEDAAAETADLEPDLEEALAELGDDYQFGEIEGDVLAELAAPLEEEVTWWLETHGKTGVKFKERSKRI